MNSIAYYFCIKFVGSIYFILVYCIILELQSHMIKTLWFLNFKLSHFRSTEHVTIFCVDDELSSDYNVTYMNYEFEIKKNKNTRKRPSVWGGAGSANYKHSEHAWLQPPLNPSLLMAGV